MSSVHRGATVAILALLLTAHDAGVGHARAAAEPGTFGDFDGDGNADLAVYRPAGGMWLVQGQSPVQWGFSGDIPVPGDYDGDGKTDIAVYRSSTYQWFVRGQPGWRLTNLTSIPVPADYDGDGRTDAALFAPGQPGRSYFSPQAVNFSNAIVFGAAGDTPLPADVDGDGKADLVVYRPSTATWYTTTAASNYQSISATPFGLPGDVPLTGDIDGDGRADLVVFRPSLGRWLALGTTESFDVAFGASGDVPMLLDVTGDGVRDLCLWKPATGTWLTFDRVGTGMIATQPLGAVGDVPALEPPRPHPPRAADFDGDGLDDLTIYRDVAGVGYWYQRFSASNPVFATSGLTQWGLGGDVTVAGDYDGDRKTDYAVFRPANGVWYLKFSSGGTRDVQWALPGDLPVPADLDGDGRTDLAVYRRSSGEWFVLLSTTDYTQFLYETQYFGGGSPAFEDRPFLGDFDGDRFPDFVVYRPSDGRWYIRFRTEFIVQNRAASFQFGLASDIPLVIDADGNGVMDRALYRGDGYWYTQESLGVLIVSVRQLGLAGDTPVPHDYDGDAITDIAVWRPNNGVWYLRQSSNDAVLTYQWGLSGDHPLLRIGR